MKRNLLFVSALVLAIAVSSFTVTRVNYKYMMFNGGAEDQVGNYSINAGGLPNHQYNSAASAAIVWVRVDDASGNNLISQEEFEVAFDEYNDVASGSNLLRDENADISGELDLIHKQ